MSNRILVTGATGNVGLEVVRLLHEQGYQVKAAVRSHTGSSISLLTNIETVAFDFEQPQTFESAFLGITTLFLVRPPAISRVKKCIYPAIASALSAGVRHIVFLSLLGAERSPIVPHARIEAYIKSALST